MPNNESTKINTLMDQLERDLSELFDLGSGDALTAAKAVLANRSSSLESFQKAFPIGAARIAFAVADEGNFKKLVETFPQQAKPLLEARKLTVNNFLTIREHPAAEKLLGEYMVKGLPDSIVGLQGELLWVGRSPMLDPQAKIRFLGRDEKLLLESVLDPDDLTFLAAAFARIAADQFVEIEKLDGHVDLQYKTNIGERIRQLEQHLKTLREHAIKLGIDGKPSTAPANI